MSGIISIVAGFALYTKYVFTLLPPCPLGYLTGLVSAEQTRLDSKDVTINWCVLGNLHGNEKCLWS